MDPESTLALYFAENRFVNEGPNDLISSRFDFHHIIPDVIPSITPTVDLAIRYPEPPPPAPPRPDEFGWVKPLEPNFTRYEDGRVRCGALLSVGETFEQPDLEIGVFEKGEKLFTLVMVDPDVPHATLPTFTSHLHWLLPNIRASPSKRLLSASDLPKALVDYVPPHPHKGTAPHRYTLLLLEHVDGKELDFKKPERENFVFRDWAWEMEGKLRLVSGVTFRAIWDEEACSRVWREVLSKFSSRSFTMASVLTLSRLADKPEVQYVKPTDGRRMYFDVDGYNRALNPHNIPGLGKALMSKTTVAGKVTGEDMNMRGLGSMKEAKRNGKIDTEDGQ